MNWLRELPWGAFKRGHRSITQVGLVRCATEMVAARVRLDCDGYVIEQWQAAALRSREAKDAVVQLARTGIFRNAPLVLVLGSEHYNTYPLQAPAVPAAEMRDALRWKLRDMLPYAPEEAVVEFVPLAHGRAQHEAASLLAVAAPRRDVAQAVEPLAAAGIEVHAVDIAETAQRNLLNRLPGLEPDRALLGLDEGSALLTVLHEGELCLARRIAIARAADDQEEDPEHVAARIATQVQRSLEVVERQSGLPPIRTVWIGPHPFCALIARCTAEQSGLECRQLDMPTELRFADGVAPLPAELAPLALLAIGAALRDEGQTASPPAHAPAEAGAV